MDKDRIAALTAVAACGEQIKQNSAEYLWICRGIRPPPLPDSPIRTDPGVSGEHLQQQRGDIRPPARPRLGVHHD